MIRQTTLMLFTAVLTVSFTADADAKSRSRKRTAQPVAAQWGVPGFQQPAHMIEVRPGIWISSYGCITDEGYGRYNSCDITDGGGGR